MKQLSVILSIFLLLVSVSGLLSGCASSQGAVVKEPVVKEVVAGDKCTMPKGTVFVVLHRMMGPVPIAAAEDTTITITEVKTAKDGTKIAIFSLSYDKPSKTCPQHGKDTYEMYYQNLGSDKSMVKIDFLECRE